MCVCVCVCLCVCLQARNIKNVPVTNYDRTSRTLATLREEIFSLRSELLRTKLEQQLLGGMNTPWTARNVETVDTSVMVEVCVCVSERERERERGRCTERETDSQTNRERYIYCIYSNKRCGVYLFQAEYLGRSLLEGGHYWRVAIVSTYVCIRPSRPFSSTVPVPVCVKKVTLVHIQCSQLVCVII